MIETEFLRMRSPHFAYPHRWSTCDCPLPVLVHRMHADFGDVHRLRVKFAQCTPKIPTTATRRTRSND